MEEFVNIATVRDELQARLVAAVLEEREIPHLLRSYRDLAFNGVFQGPSIWGRIEAPASRREEILTIIADLDEAVPPPADAEGIRGNQEGDGR